MEINLFSLGGLSSAAKFEKVDFSHPVIAALERKAAARKRNGSAFTNRQLATL